MRMKAGVKAEQVRAAKRQEVTKPFNYATPAKRKKKLKATTRQWWPTKRVLSLVGMLKPFRLVDILSQDLCGCL